MKIYRILLSLFLRIDFYIAHSSNGDSYSTQQQSVPTSPCKTKSSNCFKCSLYSTFNNPSCVLRESECSTLFMRLTPAWFQYFDSCFNDNYLMEKYCGEVDISSYPYKIALNEVNSVYGAKNLYCEYDLTGIDPYQDFSISFKNQLPSMNYHVSFYVYSNSEERDTLYTIREKQVSFTINNTKRVKIFFFTPTAFETSPFTFSLEDKGQLNYFTVILICVVTIPVGLFFVYVLMRYFTTRGDRANVEIARQDINVVKKYIDEMKEEKYEKVENVYNNNCTICIDEFNTESFVSILTCRHIFHFECLKTWLSKNAEKMKINCPVCGHQIAPVLIGENVAESRINIIHVLQRENIDLVQNALAINNQIDPNIINEPVENNIEINLNNNTSNNQNNQIEYSQVNMVNMVPIVEGNNNDNNINIQ